VKREYWRYLPFVFPYALRHKGHLAGSVLLMLVGAGAALLEPLPLALLVDGVFSGHEPPGVVAALFGTSASTLILVAVFGSLGIVLLVNGIGVAESFVNTRLEQRIALDLRYDLFGHCLRLSRAFHDVTSPGDYIYRINYEAHSAGAITVAFMPLIQSLLTLMGMFAVTYHLAPTLALLALTVVPFIYWCTGIYGKVIEPRLIKARELEGESLSIVNQTMQFLKVIIAFNRQPFELNRFQRQGERAVAMRIKVTVFQTLFNLGVAVITATGTALIIGVGAHAVLDAELTIGELLIVLAYVASIYKPLQTISATMALFQDQLIGIRFGKAMLEMPPEVVDAPDAVELESVDGAIEFQDVSFHYETREQTLLGISFSVAAGETVAVVGATGAGKSTLVSLIPRFFDPHEGRILLDGRDLRTIGQRSLRAHIAVVSQEAQLFSGTVSENILYGRLDADHDEVVAAAVAANAHDFIMGLPQQYDTQLGDQGARLSGGERQRLCIARAFLKDAPVLLLDEPTSSIDSKTESVILEALERLARGRTTITIAHRLSTVRSADRLLVMDQGRLVEHGTHDELVARQGLYAALHALQSRVPGRAGAEAVEAVEAVVEVPSQRVAPCALGAAGPEVGASCPVLRRPPVVVVLGMMSKMPVPGVIWQTVQYLAGLELLGCTVYYVEAYGAAPTMLMTPGDPSGTRAATEFLDRTLTRFGFAGRWAYQALHDGGACHGLPLERVRELYRTADLVINLHGGTAPPPEEASGRLLYLETDPVQMQVEVHDGSAEAIAFLGAHDLFFTFGENIGSTRCPLPAPRDFRFLPTRQPVVLSYWRGKPFDGPARFTTIGNWRQDGREVWLDGKCYHWSKHLEMLELLDLPSVCDVPLELALGKCGDVDRALLVSQGWTVRDSREVSRDVDVYRDFIARSCGELTVAKDQNVRLRTGWFSDRSATYLASGRPVVTQDTGVGDVLPTGAGLLCFTDVDSAAGAVDDVMGSYRHHRRAAREIAREFFAHDHVLPPLLAAAGITTPRTALLPTVLPRTPFPSDLDLVPVSRHPTELAPRTLAALAEIPWPRGTEPGQVRAGAPDVTVVVVTFDGLPFTRFALETLLARPNALTLEVVVVDNGSRDGTLDYLDHLTRVDPRVRVLANDENLGFAAAVNLGVQAGSGDRIVLLNNDTVLADGWLERLIAHTEDVSVGLVGATTNGAPNQARVEPGYTTYGGLLRFAGDTARARAGEVFDIPVVTMFCVALRRAVYERLGPLDERFWPGMFEDDDYAMRARAAGLRVVCARDVYVHHFGEASFGELVPTGEHGEAFRANRARFEQKWGVRWDPHHAAVPDDYHRLRGQVREAIQDVVPQGKTVLVVSRGDEELLSVEGPIARHFPQGDDGAFAGWYPASAAEAVEHLEQLRGLGAEYIAFPSTSMWWLEHYDELRLHLEERYQSEAVDGTCLIYGPAS